MAWNMNPIYHDVDGAPVRIGDTVAVCQVLDCTVDACYIGMAGRIVYLEYECGCGQTYPDDPMIGVRFDDGHIQEFWKEEVRYMRIRMKVSLGATGVLVLLGVIAVAAGRPDWASLSIFLAIAVAGCACIKEVQRG